MRNLTNILSGPVLLIIASFFMFNAASNEWLAAWQEEQSYLHLQLQFKSEKANLRFNKQQNQFPESLVVDALVDLEQEDELHFLLALRQQHWDDFSQLEEQIRIATLQFTKLQQPFPAPLRQIILQKLADGTLSERAYLLCRQLPVPFQINWSQYPDFPRTAWSEKWPSDKIFISKTPQELRDLYHYQIPANSLQQGIYGKVPKVFLFCRQNRSYPCRMLMKDANNLPVRTNNGELWSQPALGMSAKNISYSKRNGHTPSGIHLINSVMPVADDRKAFGKFRRLILNWVPQSQNELLHRQLLPASAQNASWWKEGVLARDIGRNLLRIHGTGRINNNPHSNYYPLTPTSGCISQRENTYQLVTYRDQRKLLDQMMLATGLDATYSNETKIRGILYLIEINTDKRAVTLEELEELLAI